MAASAGCAAGRAAVVLLLLPLVCAPRTEPENFKSKLPNSHYNLSSYFVAKRRTSSPANADEERTTSTSSIARWRSLTGHILQQYGQHTGKA